MHDKKQFPFLSGLTGTTHNPMNTVRKLWGGERRFPKNDVEMLPRIQLLYE